MTTNHLKQSNTIKEGRKAYRDELRECDCPYHFHYQKNKYDWWQYGMSSERVANGGAKASDYYDY